jgi:radical SAM-linked protein
MKVQRLRVTFARGDLLRYITHLDLMRAWERALKRAALPVAYSEGFTRHPQIALAAPLPVGATGDGELMDVFVEEAIDPADFAARLRAQTPPGLDVREVVEVPLAWPSLQSLVREWSWRAQLPPETDAAALRAAVAAFLARDSFPWEHRREKEVKRYDLRALVLALEVEENAEGPALRARLKAEAGGRPEQLVAALGFDPRAARIHRLALVLEQPAVAAAEGR